MGCLAALWQDWCLREPAARMLSTILSEYPSHPPKYRWRALRSGGIGVPTTCRLAVLMLLLLLLPLHVFRGAFITRAVAAFAIKPLSYARVRFQQAALSSLGHRTCSLSLHFLFFFFRCPCTLFIFVPPCRGKPKHRGNFLRYVYGGKIEFRGAGTRI